MNLVTEVSYINSEAILSPVHIRNDGYLYTLLRDPTLVIPLHIGMGYNWDPCKKELLDVLIKYEFLRSEKHIRRLC